MIRAETSVVINCPVENVEAFFNDLDRQSQWISGLIEMRILTEGPIQTGSQIKDVRQMFGQHLESTIEVTEYVPNHKRSFKSIEGPMSGVATTTLEAVEGGTRVHYTIEGEMKGAFKFADPILNRMIQRQVETDFSNLKDLLEA